MSDAVSVDSLPGSPSRTRGSPVPFKGPLTPEETAALGDMRDRLVSAGFAKGRIGEDAYIQRFLMARKFNVDRAVDLYKNYTEQFGNVQLEMVDVVDTFREGKLVLLGTRARDDAAILLFTARLHANAASYNATVALAVYLLSVASGDLETQRSGITFIVDMAGAGWRNFDLGLQNHLLSMIQNNFPARLKRVLIVNPPWWISLIMKAAVPFMKPKLAAKIQVVDLDGIIEHCPPSSLPVDLGGELTIDIDKFISERAVAETQRKSLPVMEGYLSKTGPGGKGWKRRYFVLRNSELAYHEDSDSRVPIRSVPLYAITAIEPDTASGKEHAFKIVTQTRTFLVRADTRKEMDGWIAVIRSRRPSLRGDDHPDTNALQLPSGASSRRTSMDPQRASDSASIGGSGATAAAAAAAAAVSTAAAPASSSGSGRDKKAGTAEAERLEFERKAKEERFEKQNAKRTNIVKELLATEQSYVDNLTMILEVFLKPLRAAVDAGKPIISNTEIKKMFPEMESIAAFNLQLKTELSARVKDWSPRQKVGDVFVKLIVYLKMYTFFVNNYPIAVETVTRLQNENATFKQFVKEAQSKPECRMIGLAEHLLTPIQRVPRYVLLLEDLKKNTDTTHPDFNDIVTALEKMKEVANYINEAKREAELRLKVVAIQDSVKQMPESFVLVEPQRRFIAETDFVELEEGQGKDTGKFHPRRQVRSFLFNDLILVAKRKEKSKTHVFYKYMHKADLETVIVADAPGVGDSVFQILYTSDNLRRQTLQAASPAAKQEFLAGVESLKATEPTLLRRSQLEEKDRERERERKSMGLMPPVDDVTKTRAGSDVSIRESGERSPGGGSTPVSPSTASSVRSSVASTSASSAAPI